MLRFCRRPAHWSGWPIAVVLSIGVGAWPPLAGAQPRPARNSESTTTYDLRPVVIGQSIERTYDALRVPATLSDPCFLDRDDMTVSCRLGEARVFGPGRTLAPDALPVPSDSLRLTALSESGLVIGFDVFYRALGGAAFDSAAAAVGRVLVREWGTAERTVGSCKAWGISEAAVWSASLCVWADRRTIVFGVSPRSADVARAFFRRREPSLPLPLDPDDLPPDDEPWWSPRWEPFTLGGLVLGRTLGSVGAAAGVPSSAARCRRPERDADDSLHVHCTWARPRLTLAGLTPTLLETNAIRDLDRGLTKVYGVTLTFGGFSLPKSAAARDCAAVAVALREQWGAPSSESRDSEDCQVEWARPPFTAMLSTAVDDRYASPDHWGVMLHFGMVDRAVPPGAWQR